MFVIALMYIYNFMFAGVDTSHGAMERRSPLYPHPKTKFLTPEVAASRMIYGK